MSSARQSKASSRVLSALRATMELCNGGTLPSDEAMNLLELKLGQYPERSVLAALDRCLTEVTGRLSLAHIVERIEEARADGWPGANEAWAAVGDRGEADTIVCVGEAFVALETARALLDSDAVAARMAFMESYKRLVAQAKAEGRRPEWRASLGYDKAGRERAMLKAVERGWLPRPEAERMLGETLGPKALPGAGLKMLTGAAPLPTKDTAARFSELLGTFVNPELARQALEERRREWGAKPIAKPESEYRPPNREEVAAIRRQQGQGR